MYTFVIYKGAPLHSAHIHTHVYDGSLDSTIKIMKFYHEIMKNKLSHVRLKSRDYE
jgi:hypothetical protein